MSYCHLHRRQTHIINSFYDSFTPNSTLETVQFSHFALQWLHSSLVPRVTPLGEGKIWHDILMSYPWVSSVTGASRGPLSPHSHPHEQDAYAHAHACTQACGRQCSTIQGPPSCSRLSASPRIPQTTVNFTTLVCHPPPLPVLNLHASPRVTVVCFLLPSPIGIALPLTGWHGERIPIPPPFMLQPHPNPAPPAGSSVTRAVQGTIGWMGYLSGRMGIALRDAVVYRLFRFTIGQTLVLRDTADCSGESDCSNIYLQIPSVVLEEGTDNVLWFKERVMTQDDIVESMVDSATSYLRWSIHRPNHGWYL
ncbi:hypothetical protein JB92DRAFT_2826772 [Gautieria morchelliformis]|nr:hypothetical protein JB92DRAFT_2826772 [Gautieria morchelliformis]